MRRIPAFPLVLLAVPAFASSMVGETLPSFDGTTVAGQKKSSKELLGHKTILIVLPSREAAKEAATWGKEATKALGAEKVAVESVVALDLPFFIGLDDAISHARKKVPKKAWSHTWLSDDGDVKKEFPIQQEDIPYVYAVDASGTIVASTQGSYDPQRAQALFQSLR
jgi:hypothetical protein